MTPSARARRLTTRLLVALGVIAVGGLLAVLPAAAASAAPGDPTPVPTPGIGSTLTIGINGPDGAPSQSVLVLLGVTALSIAPALLLCVTSFTKIFMVLAMTRNALGLNTLPPTQVIAGLALFLSIFIMWPVLTQINADAVQPYMNGTIDFQQAIHVGLGPLRTWMLAHTREQDLALMTRAAGLDNPHDPSSVPTQTLIPSFMLSEMRSAFIIGFVVFVPFLVIDLVVSSGLMALGMMMLPPVMVSLPFKILLFVLVDGWGLIIQALIGSYTHAGGGG